MEADIVNWGGSLAQIIPFPLREASVNLSGESAAVFVPHDLVLHTGHS